MGWFKVLGVGALFSSSLFAQSVDLKSIEASLSGAGLSGWIHGSAADLGHYVFTYRDPQDFFIHQEFSLVPENSAVENDLKKLKRHDAVTLFGKFAPATSEQIHIQVSKVQLDKVFDPGIAVPDYQRSVQIPQDLAGKTSFLATVHAVAGGGEVLVVEYRDAVLPVFVRDKTQAASLYRGDKIRIHFKIQRHPVRPTHLVLAATPIELLTPIKDQDGKLLDLEGALVYFPQSPQLRFGVYALQVVDTDGLKLNYTLVNFEDPQVFADIRAKLESFWKANLATVENGRNCLINPKIKIRAVGKGNVMSPNQANPQILLEGVDSVSLVSP